ncbi:MAG: type II toxin-antitoxin system RelE/ParE family toxin [Clostridiales bacterium]|nr:type II toxin-antitoxin system RelE/ParE family toxin [Clostridiales bacterium]
MNRKKALLLLFQIFNGLLDERFSIHELIQDELLDILKNSGAEQKVFNLLVARLNLLQFYWERACELREFEPLRNGIYSMHIDTANMNVRILYAFNGSKVYLLHAFFERGGKKHTDYTGRIELAQKRLNEMKE